MCPTDDPLLHQPAAFAACTTSAYPPLSPYKLGRTLPAALHTPRVDRRVVRLLRRSMGRPPKKTVARRNNGRQAPRESTGKTLQYTT